MNEAGLLYGSIVIVEGPSVQSGVSQGMTVSSTARSSNMGSSSTFSSNPPPPTFRSVVPISKQLPPVKEPSANVKIVKANMNHHKNGGKFEFFEVAQTHLDISESTANVGHVLKEIKSKWGDDYVIVTIDGLQLEDSEGTRGIILKIVFPRITVCMRMMQ